MITRRRFLTEASAGAAGLGLLSWPNGSSSGGQTGGATSRDTYFPPAEGGGGWRVGEARALGVDADRLQEAIRYQDEAFVTRSRGGALVIIYRGHIIGESYVTGTEGGPQRWTARTCNDMKSSTKSVFGTAVWGLSGRIPGSGGSGNVSGWEVSRRDAHSSDMGSTSHG